jgi:hypothetical protein
MRTLLLICAVIFTSAITTIVSPVRADEQHNFQLQVPEPWRKTERHYWGDYQLKQPAYPYDLNLHPHYPEPWLPGPNIPTPSKKNAYEDLTKRIEPLKKHFGSMDDPLPPRH